MSTIVRADGSRWYREETTGDEWPLFSRVKLTMRVRWQVLLTAHDGVVWDCGMYTRKTHAEEWAKHVVIHRTFGDGTAKVQKVEVWK